MDRLDCKTLLLRSSAFGMLLSRVFVVLALVGIFNIMVVLLAVNLHVINFELGLGPVPWIITEFVDAAFVATAMLTPCSQVPRRCNVVVGLMCHS